MPPRGASIGATARAMQPNSGTSRVRGSKSPAMDSRSINASIDAFDEAFGTDSRSYHNHQGNYGTLVSDGTMPASRSPSQSDVKSFYEVYPEAKGS
jgi:hypothetical protein